MRFPVLLVEDDEDAVGRFRLIAEAAQKLAGVQLKADVKLKTEVAPDYDAGESLLATGEYPIAIIDLALPDPLQHATAHYPGLPLIEKARIANKDVLVGTYSSHASEEPEDLVALGVDAILPKTGDQIDKRKNIPRLCKLIVDAAQTFNYAVDVDTDEACSMAFSPNGRWQEQRRRYEICLRRLLAHVTDEVYYDAIGQGRSGAGVVAFYSGPLCPEVLKFGEYVELEREVGNYERLVRNRIGRCAKTDGKRLAQAGALGCIAYSFEGDIGNPRTLGSVIQDRSIPIENVQEGIAEHFSENCKRWFLNREERPYDLTSGCRNHYFQSTKSIRDSVFEFVPEQALVSSAAHIIKRSGDTTLTPRGLADTIIGSVMKKRGNVNCLVRSIAHGDLNVGNLVWNARSKMLTMIDYAKMAEAAPRMLDFTKLEASIKYHIPCLHDSENKPEDGIRRSLELEDRVMESLQVNGRAVEELSDELMRRKLRAIASIRSCALQQCGPRATDEYFLALLFVTVKHIGYSARDMAKAREMNDSKWETAALVALVHALVSAYGLMVKVQHV